MLLCSSQNCKKNKKNNPRLLFYLIKVQKSKKIK